MRASGFVVLAFLASGCGIPLRDNGNDPAVRPVASTTVYVLQPASPLSTPVLQFEGVSYEAVIRDSGYLDDIFLIDASGSADPDDPETKLQYFWKLGANEPVRIEQLCPDGTLSEKCHVLRASELPADLPRNAPIPLSVRVEDPAGHVDEEPVGARLLDHPPSAAAGPDWVLPISTDIFHVVLDGDASTDSDPSAASPGLATYCWEQVLPTTPLVITTGAASAGSCPASGPLWTVARSIAFDVATTGEPPVYRFRLHVRDGYAWSEPDSIDVQVGPSALWTINDVPAIGERRAPGLFRLDVTQSGGNIPIVATALDGETAWAVTNDGQSSFEAIRVGADGSFERKQATTFMPDVAGIKFFRSAVLDQNGDLWAAAEWNGGSDTQIIRNAVLDTSFSSSIATGFPGQQAPDLLVSDPAGGIWGARTGSTLVTHFAENGSGTEIEMGESFTLSSPATSMEIAPDGTLFVGTVSSLALRIGTTVAELPGLTPTALRYEEGLLPSVADDRLWIGDANQGVGFALVTALVSGGEILNIVEPGITDARFLRLSTDGGIWITRIGSGEVVRVDRITGSPLGSFVLDAPIVSAAGTSQDGGIIVSFPALTPSGISIGRIPLDDAAVLGRTESAGSVRDLSTERDDGGAWVAFESPPSVAQVDSNGARHPETILESLDGTSLSHPWRIAADARSRGLWVIERPSGGGSRWHVTERAAPGARSAPVPRAVATETALLSRIRPNGEDGGGNLRAWALDQVPGQPPRTVEATENASGGFDFNRIAIGSNSFTQAVAGPAVAPDGSGWFAVCHDGLPGFTADCRCFTANSEPTCQIGTRIGWVPSGASATSITEFAPPGVNLGCTPGGPCSIFPLDLAFDPERNALWLALEDFRDGNQAPVVQVWRFSCKTGDPLQTCAPANLNIHSNPQAFELPLLLGSLTGLLFEGSDILGVDEATGLAYFLDPTDGDILVLNAGTNGSAVNVIDVAEVARSTTARRLAIGR